jgi:hypothetical protein
LTATISPGPKRAWDRIGRLTLFLVGYGVVLILLSFPVGVAHVQLPHEHCVRVEVPLGNLTTWVPRREVGYLAAPNWSLASVLIWPAMFCVLRLLIRHADRTFADIDISPMTWLGPTDGVSVGATWRKQKGHLRRIAMFALAGAVLESVLEWRSASALPLISHRYPAEGELDWSSVPVGTSHLSHIAQAGFSLAAFLYQAIVLTLIASFAATAILMARTMTLHGSGEIRPELLIDIESNDPAKRGGFERFALIIDLMIVFVSLSFVTLFFTRIQNAYLRDYNHTSMGDFIQQDFFVPKIEDFPKLLEIRALDFSSAAAAAGAIIIMFQCFFFFNAALRYAAIQARNRSDHVLVRSTVLRKARATGLDRSEIRSRLQSVNVWPLGYSDLMPTLSLLTLCVIIMVFYKLGIYLAFAWVTSWFVARSARGLIKGG